MKCKHPEEACINMTFYHGNVYCDSNRCSLEEVNNMDKDTAIKILKALACCSMNKLHCYECPMWREYGSEEELGGSCYGWCDDDVVKAVRTLNRNTEGN